MYQDFEPVGVLDWEMATIGPREMDLRWMVFAHQVFESITEVFGMPGHAALPARGGRPRDVRTTSPARSWATSTWYHLYNGVQWCVVFMRTGVRSIHFGEVEKPDDVESLFHRKPLIERLLAKVGRRLITGLDEYPIHQLPQPMADVGSSDRNFYDRWYFNAHDRTGDIFAIFGAGYYPNLGVKDAFVMVRRGDEQTAVHLSDAMDHDRLNPHIGGFRIEVVQAAGGGQGRPRGDRGHRHGHPLARPVPGHPGGAARDAHRDAEEDPRRAAVRAVRLVGGHDLDRRHGSRRHAGHVDRLPGPVVGHPPLR